VPDTPDAADVVAALQEANARLRSDKTTRDRYAIRGYGSTAVKHGTDVFTAIRDALAGNPWTPPVPASA
jgi:transposase